MPRVRRALIDGSLLLILRAFHRGERFDQRAFFEGKQEPSNRDGFPFSLGTNKGRLVGYSYRVRTARKRVALRSAQGQKLTSTRVEESSACARSGHSHTLIAWP
jgi:hypothetical protein